MLPVVVVVAVANEGDLLVKQIFCLRLVQTWNLCGTNDYGIIILTKELQSEKSTTRRSKMEIALVPVLDDNYAYLLIDSARRT